MSFTFDGVVSSIFYEKYADGRECHFVNLIGYDRSIRSLLVLPHDDKKQYPDPAGLSPGQRIKIEGIPEKQYRSDHVTTKHPRELIVSWEIRQ